MVAHGQTTECKFLITFQKKHTFKYSVPSEEGNRAHSIGYTQNKV